MGQTFRGMVLGQGYGVGSGVCCWVRVCGFRGMVLISETRVQGHGVDIRVRGFRGMVFFRVCGFRGRVCGFRGMVLPAARL